MTGTSELEAISLATSVKSLTSDSYVVTNPLSGSGKKSLIFQTIATFLKAVTLCLDAMRFNNGMKSDASNEIG